MAKKRFLAVLTAMCALTMTACFTSCSNEDALLIYDAKGTLVSKLGAETDKLQPLTFETGELAEGTYTAVVWQTVRNSSGFRYWKAYDEEQLSTVNIIGGDVGAFYEWALGVASATFTADGGSFEVSLSPKSTGSIVEMQVDGLEKSGLDNIHLYGPVSEGIKLDPSLSDADRWLKAYYIPLAQASLDQPVNKFFTMAHGDNIDLYLCYYADDDLHQIAFSLHQMLDQGKIAEQGTFEELMANKGLFYEMSLRQL